MRGWATPENLYSFWPALANAAAFTDERLEEHIETAEEEVAADLEVMGFDVAGLTSPRSLIKLRHLVCYKTLSDILIYPLDNSPNPVNVGRASDVFEERYRRALSDVAFNPKLIDATRAMQYGPITHGSQGLTQRRPLQT